VQTGEVRRAALAAIGAVAQDAIVVGEGRDDLGLLVFLDREAARGLAEAEIAARIGQALARYNAPHSAATRRIARAVAIAEPPSLAEGEITDKGTLNRRAILARREALLKLLYSSKIDPRVIRPGPDRA